MSELVVGFQAGIAGTFEDIVATMQATHDVVINRAGRRRISGVSWEIWGSELAGVLARTKTGVRVAQPGGICGTLDEGLDRLDRLFDGSFGDDATHDTTDPGAAVYRSFAASLPDSTLIIAFCDIRIPDRTPR